MAEVYVAPWVGPFANSYREDNKLPFVVWDNFLNRTNTVASSTSSATSVLNVIEENTVDFWRPAAAGNSWIRVDGVDNRLIDTVAIRGHNLFSIGATIRVRNGSGVTIAEYVPKSNGVIVISFPEVRGISQLYVDFISTGQALVGSLLVGRKLIFPRGIDGSGFRQIEFSTVTDLLVNKSQSGQLINNRVVRRGISADLPINPIDYAFAHGRFKQFVKHYNDGRPFLFTSSPSLAPNDAGWFWRPASASDMDVTTISSGMYAQFSIPAEGVHS